MRRALATLALALTVLCDARADYPDPPAMRALLLLPIPSDSAIAIEPRDDSEANLKLRDLMIARLLERRGRVADEGPLVLRFSLTVISGRDTPRDGPGNRFGHYGGGRAPPNAIPRDTPVSYRLSATLQQRDGPMLWKADVTAPIGDQDDDELTARLAAILIDNIGRTVDSSLPVDPPHHPTPD
jgi:hypothetical protein